jgi:hypothetical protein
MKTSAKICLELKLVALSSSSTDAEVADTPVWTKATHYFSELELGAFSLPVL